MAAKSKETKIIIGAREIGKGVKSGSVKKVIVAKNCPQSAVDKLGNVKIDVFDGDQTQLGTKLGKPFPVAMVGFSDIYAELK
ncbi:MAG: ribosomal L7Ae/L30e/S12e/Gadd45 family protein [Candidatus Aenigmarchaeota archaeon]|nr:ribosomal L7Ae/L30e/S12e/Gadd45 family protein [Candidatus Aenigmarchaeota archaeon]